MLYYKNEYKNHDIFEIIEKKPSIYFTKTNFQGQNYF
jgi:hypothetical protein